MPVWSASECVRTSASTSAGVRPIWARSASRSFANPGMPASTAVSRAAVVDDVPVDHLVAQAVHARDDLDGPLHGAILAAYRELGTSSSRSCFAAATMFFSDGSTSS